MRRAVGVDLGRDQIKVVLVEHSSKDLRVVARERFARISPDDVAHRVRAFQRKENAVRAPVELALSDAEVSFRVFEFEDRRRLVPHLRRLTRLEWEEEFERGLDDWVCDAALLAEDGGQVIALAAAAEAAALKSWLEAFRSVGIEPDGLHPGLSCLALGGNQFEGGGKRKIATERLVDLTIQRRIVERRPPAIGQVDLPARGKRSQGLNGRASRYLSIRTPHPPHEQPSDEPPKRLTANRVQDSHSAWFNVNHSSDKTTGIACYLEPVGPKTVGPAKQRK